MKQYPKIRAAFAKGDAVAWEQIDAIQAEVDLTGDAHGKAKDLYESLAAEGFDIAYATVRKRVSLARYDWNASPSQRSLFRSSSVAAISDLSTLSQEAAAAVIMANGGRVKLAEARALAKMGVDAHSKPAAFDPAAFDKKVIRPFQRGLRGFRH